MKATVKPAKRQSGWVRPSAALVKSLQSEVQTAREAQKVAENQRDYWRSSSKTHSVNYDRASEKLRDARIALMQYEDTHTASDVVTTIMFFTIIVLAVVAAIGWIA